MQNLGKELERLTLSDLTELLKETVIRLGRHGLLEQDELGRADELIQEAGEPPIEAETCRGMKRAA